MITFSQLGMHGRLGNQLFQYALLKAVSIKTKHEIILSSDLNNKIWHGQKCLLQNFKLNSAKYFDVNLKNQYIEKDTTQYDKKVFQIKESTDFHGYFQNVEYFSDILPEVRNEFAINIEIKEKVKTFINKYPGVKTSLHVRRGDSSDGTNPQLDSITNNFSKDSILYRYYNKALQEVPKESTIFLFTGGSRNENDNNNDIHWCKNNFKDNRIIYVDELNDIESFCCMTLCDFNIISFFSTFGLWAAYLNEKAKVIAPQKFYPHRKNEIENLYLLDWNIISYE